eukprot:4326290-Prymnesium_polylepis.2
MLCHASPSCSESSNGSTGGTARKRGDRRGVLSAAVGGGAPGGERGGTGCTASGSFRFPSRPAIVCCVPAATAATPSLARVVCFAGRPCPRSPAGLAAPVALAAGFAAALVALA